MCISSIPVPKTKTSQKLRVVFVSFIMIFSEVPVALDSHENDLISPVVMSLLDDPHFLYVPSCGPTVILKLRNMLPIVQLM